MKNDLCDGTQAVAASEGILRALARKTGIDKKMKRQVTGIIIMAFKKIVTPCHRGMAIGEEGF